MLYKIKHLSAISAALGLAAISNASTIVYQDGFDNDGLGTNVGDGSFGGIGGGAVNRTISVGVWSDSGDATLAFTNVRFSRNAILYSSNAFQSSGGFQLDVDYTIANLTTSGGNDFSFGIVSSDTDFSTYGTSADASDDPFGVITSVYSLGVSIPNAGKQGLNFTDGSTRTLLDSSGNNAQFAAGTSTAVSISIGTGGAWSYSIGGVEEATGTIVGGFDLSKSYRFVAYGQDNNHAKSIQSVTLTAIPEPSAFALLAGLTGLVFVMTRRRRA